VAGFSVEIFLQERQRADDMLHYVSITYFIASDPAPFVVKAKGKLKLS